MIKKRKLRLIIFKKAFMSKNYKNIIKINTKILNNAQNFINTDKQKDINVYVNNC